MLCVFSEIFKVFFGLVLLVRSCSAFFPPKKIILFLLYFSHHSSPAFRFGEDVYRTRVHVFFMPNSDGTKETGCRDNSGSSKKIVIVRIENRGQESGSRIDVRYSSQRGALHFFCIIMVWDLDHGRKTQEKILRKKVSIFVHSVSRLSRYMTRKNRGAYLPWPHTRN